MPSNMVKTKADEKKWSDAKKAAPGSGKEERWGLVNYIFQRMKQAKGK